ncbi:MAG: hypothetical protein AB7U61_05535 [Methylocystis sp.]
MTMRANIESANSSAAPATQDANPILAAIERHKAAWAAFSGFNGDDGECGRRSDLEDAAIMELALAPCASDAEFVEKLKYLLARHDRLHGLDEYAAILAAIRQHTEGGDDDHDQRKNFGGKSSRSDRPFARVVDSHGGADRRLPPRNWKKDLMAIYQLADEIQDRTAEANRQFHEVAEALS